MVKSANLLKRLESLGFPLLLTEKSEDASLTLSDVVKSHDLRLWEGFPVVLANVAEKRLFDYAKVAAYLKKPFDKKTLASLVIMSVALYKVSGLTSSWMTDLRRTFYNKNKKEYESYVRLLKKDLDLAVGGHKMSGERLKTNFNNYFNTVNSSFSNLLSSKEEFGLEHALSQVFSPKQKELFLRKLKGEKFTKTEKEYFSRTVKKKIAALANSELNRLSRKLLE